ncbi:hypothetical protein ACFO0N_04190 [Halobium salinum]|uniref:HEPN domain-containing protein n=1 Tax=Halobium salinum TaxID=1364940 RepID=A0ABD5P8R7_9EURY|nr:hypothetical protein [Halobium salinum]
MHIRNDFDNSLVRKAQNEFEIAESRLDSALKSTGEERGTSHSTRFVDAQRSIERSTKAIFELMNVQYPPDHAINPKSQSGLNLLNAISAEVDSIEYFEQKRGHITQEELKRMHTGEVGRLMFLCYMYGNVYSLVSYGINEERFSLSPDDFVSYSDHECAIESALAGLRISDVIIDSIATGELPYTDPPTGTGPLEKRSKIRGDFYGVRLPETDYDPVPEYRREL